MDNKPSNTSTMIYYLDPVLMQNYLDNFKTKKKPNIKLLQSTNEEIEPSLEVRGVYPSVLDQQDRIICYCNPKSEMKSKQIKSLSTTDILKLPSPMDIRVYDTVAEFENLELIKESSKVSPRTPSDISLGPWPPDIVHDDYSKTQLKLRKPKSGIIIQDKSGTILDSFSIGYDRPYTNDLIKKYGLFDFLTLGLGEEEAVSPEVLENIIEVLKEQDAMDTLSKKRKKPETPSETSTIEPPQHISQWFPRGSVSRPKTYKRRTIQSHSFTNIKFSDKIVKEYKYGIKHGNYNENDIHFPIRTRGKQTFANLIVAYCFSFIKHPCLWDAQDIDDILEIGNNLYVQTLDFLHIHDSDSGYDIKASQLLTTVVLDDKKIIFTISEPLIIGLTKSDDPKVYNLYKAFSLFFNKYDCALFETKELKLIVWKSMFYYVFDSRGRAEDLYVNWEASAAVIMFFNIKNIVSMLIERSEMNNWPFTLRQVCVTKILKSDTPDDAGDGSLNVCGMNEYRILGNDKAVISASFSMADPCFDWMSNKQALAMCIIALIYTKITPSAAAWCRKTLDKILLLGNALYYEITIAGNSKDNIQLEDIPGEFTLGPYNVEITIYNSVVKGYMFARKKYPSLIKGICTFFDDSTCGILEFDKFTYAIWNQRNFYYLFDPFPRDFQGFMKPNGTAIVSMHNSIDTLIITLMKNINPDNNCVFSIHALKNIKIQRNKSIKDRSQIKPICLNLNSHAEQSFQPNTVPNASVVSVASSIISLKNEYVPTLKHHDHKMPDDSTMSRKMSKVSLGCCDLDSPSLSDTQLAAAPRPEMIKSELSLISDRVYNISTLISLLQSPEGGNDYEDYYLRMCDFEKKMLKEIDEVKRGKGYLEIEEIEYEYEEEYVPRKFQSATTMTDGFRLLKKKVLHPPKLPLSDHKKREALIVAHPIKKSETTLSKELLKQTNFISLPDGSEIICGTKTLINYDEKKIFLTAPFVVLMAIVVSHKYSLITWNSSILDYIITCGSTLQEITPQRFDEAAIHEFRRVILGSTHFTAKSTYTLDSIFKSSIMEQIFSVLFKKCSSAILVSPYYSCAIFYKNFLYYLYDPYNSNAVGLGQGNISDNASGTCCFIRFTNCHQLVARILYNKSKREGDKNYKARRYILSVVEVHRIPPKSDDDKEEVLDEDPCLKKLPIKSEKTLGYQQVDNEWLIMGTDYLKGRRIVTEKCIKECHFVSLSALLLLLHHPLNMWTSKLVDQSLEMGRNIFKYIEHKGYSKKRVVNNIFVEDKVLDLIISMLECPKTRTVSYFDFYLKKHNFLLLQFPSICLALYINKTQYHLFDPYKYKSFKARWMRFNSWNDVMRYIEMYIALPSSCTLYTFNVTKIRNTPKKTPKITKQLSKYHVQKAEFKECIDVKKPFNESENWLRQSIPPWSRLQRKNAVGQLRGVPNSMWNYWDIEYPNDLWSLWGTLHQKSTYFPSETRGKQTICNCIVCCVMCTIYDLSEWNVILLDAILKIGNQYYALCVRELSSDDKRGEFNIEHLKSDINIPPFMVKISVEPIVEGTMYVLSTKQFNLYKALLYFFNGVRQRFALIFGTNRILAFGKIGEKEYFLYDCQSYGSPLFLERQGCSYILRMNSLKRLLHTMTLTLQHGDFYIYDVKIVNVENTTGAATEVSI